MPEAGRALWDAFQQLDEGRTWYQGGPNPITWEAIAAWAALMRWPLAPRHVEVLRAMDRAYCRHLLSDRKADRTAERQPITSTIFDTLLPGA